MKNKYAWQAALGLTLIALTVVFYAIHFLIFRDLQHILIFFVGDIAFVFFEVLLVTVVIDRLLHHREQKAISDKLHMLIGAFFSEMGTELLCRCAEFDAAAPKITQHLVAPDDWSEAAFLNIRQIVGQHDADIASQDYDLVALKDYLRENKSFLLDLLQNQNLIQAEDFSNLVWAVFHLTKEFEHCCDWQALSDADHQHLTEDIKRVYQLLLVQWMDYMKHLKTDYPYLFSIAGRTNPFYIGTSVEVK